MSRAAAKNTRRAPKVKPARTKRPRIGLSLGLGRFVMLIAFTVGMTSLGIYQIYRQHELVMIGYSLDDALFEHRRLQEASKRLSLSLSAYKDPAVVRAFAEDALGMKVPGTSDELHVPDPDAHTPTAPAGVTNPGGAP